MTNKLFCFTLDLEPDFLSENSHEVLLHERNFQVFEDFILSNQIKLTAFVVGKMLDAGLPIKEKFNKINPEFALHSYSHNINETDSEIEILKGREAFYKYFGKYPSGYRAPNGDISPQGIAILAREGFKYDASIFPARRLELGYDFSKLPQDPFKYLEYPDLMEIPFAVVPKLQIVISLSFLKLFGVRFYKLLFYLYGFPEILVFDSHLYDYFITEPVKNLSRMDWRRYALMRNNKRTFKVLQEFIDFLRRKGYQSSSVGQLHQIMIQKSEDLLSISRNELANGKSG